MSPFFRLSLGCVLALAPCARAAEPLSEIEGIRRVCTGGVDADLAKAHAARGSADEAASHVLPNPSLRAEHQQILAGGNGHETILGVSVSLGLGGRRFVLQDAARARRIGAQAEAHVARFDAALAFREAYVRAAIEQARVEILLDQQAALDSLTTTVDRLAKSGEAAGYDLARQQTHALLHRQRLALARARSSAAAAALEAWTGTPVTLAPVALDALGGGSAVAPSGTRAPVLDVLAAEADARTLEATAARRKWVPDLELFAGYRTTTLGAVTDHGFSASLAIPLTLFDRGQGEAGLADSAAAIARTSAERLDRQLRAARRSAEGQLAALAVSAPDVERAAADAHATQTKAIRLYAAGEASITELIEAFRASEEAQLGRVELAAETADARLTLMRATGTLLDPTLDRACGADGAQR